MKNTAFPRAALVFAGAAILGVVVAARTRSTTSPGSMRDFDPDQVARYERLNWMYYYQKRWRELFVASIGMLRAAFGLSLPLALRSAYWVTRAEIAAAPRDNDILLAESYMVRFYRMLRRLQSEDFDPALVAARDVRWWVVHRELAIGKLDDKQPLEDALAAYYAALYGVDEARVREAARYRTLAMNYSDRWVEESRESDHPLLLEVEDALRRSYHALRAAVGGGD